MSDARMFRVIVMGGIALTTGSSLVVACGGDVSTGNTGDASIDQNFPSELPSYVEASLNDAADAADAGFPSELPSPVDSSTTDSAPDAPKDGTGD